MEVIYDHHVIQTHHTMTPVNYSYLFEIQTQPAALVTTNIF